MSSVTDSLIIDGPVEQVFAYCWDAERWPEITPHVQSIRIIQQAQNFQIMAMTVESGGRRYDTQSERRSEPPSYIEYRQLTPPSFLREHSGEWRFHSDGGRTRVELTHRFVVNHELARQMLGLQPEHDVDQYIGERLKHNGSLTLHAIKALVENKS